MAVVWYLSYTLAIDVCSFSNFVDLLFNLFSILPSKAQLIGDAHRTVTSTVSYNAPILMAHRRILRQLLWRAEHEKIRET